MLERSTDSVASPSVGEVQRQLLVVSETRLTRESVAGALRGDADLKVIGLFDNLDQAIEVIRTSPEVTVLLDATFPKGLETLKNAYETDGHGRVVIFNLPETEDDIVAWVEAGAAGYIPNTASAPEVARYLKSILHGEQICPGAIASALMRRIRSSSSPRDELSPVRSGLSLSLRESEIVRMIAAGLCNKEIARGLNIELSTTKSHVHNVLSKLGLHGRFEVARWAHDQGELLHHARANAIRMSDAAGDI